MIITITGTTFDTDASGVQSRVTSVYWTASEVDGNVTGSFSGQTGIAADYVPAQKPYANVTEADCLAWVSDIEDEARIQAFVDRSIQEQLVPTSGVGIPWQESFPLWATDVAYSVDDVVIYGGTGYECIQSHTSTSTWLPSITPALWNTYVPSSEGPQAWVQPIGAQDAYAIGAVVTHNGHKWTSTTPANVWEPGVFGWTDDGVYP